MIPCYYEDTEHAKPAETAADVQKYEKHTYTEKDDTTGSTVEDGGKGWKTFYYTKFKDWEDTAASSYGNDSVEKYGGFYIARYEAGWEETKTENLKKETVYVEKDWNSEKTKKNDNVGNKKPISKPNVFAWNFISQETALNVASKMYENSNTEGYANSYLVDGTAWDTITNWIAKDEVDVTVSTSYGNYLDNGSNYTGWYAEHIWSTQVNAGKGGITGWLYANKFKNGPITLHWKDVTVDNWKTMKDDIANDNENTNATDYNLDTRIEIPTGSYNGFKLKNIYDLAGNMWEWTTEVGKHDVMNGSSFAVFRGGCFNVNGTSRPLCFRYGLRSSSSICELRVPCRALCKVALNTARLLASSQNKIEM